MEFKSVISLILFLFYYIQFGFCEISYTSQEKDAIKQLRQEMGNGEPYSLQYKDYMRNNEFLIRFLRDQKLNVDQAKLKLLNTLNWRKQKKIDIIITESMSDMHKVFPYSMEGEDLSGNILVTVPFSSWDLRKFMLRGNGRERMARYTAKLLERGLVKSIAKNVTHAIIIMDMSNYNAKQHGCAACLPFYFDLLNQYEMYYPQTVKSFNFINTPRIWEAVSKLLLPIISPATNDIVQIYGYNKKEWQTELLKTISPNQLTPQFGGTKKN